jgi:O-antigen ligase
MRKSSYDVMPAFNLDKDRLGDFADWFAVAIAVALPWSTSAVSILLVLWAIVLIPTLDTEDVKREVLTPFGALPFLLFFLGAIGTVWATDATWHERLNGLDGFVKPLVIPLLALQFSRSDKGQYVMLGFLSACLLLLIGSVVVAIWPTIPRGSNDFGVLVKAYIVQSIEFTICAAALLDAAARRAQAGKWLQTVGLALLGAAFLADVLFVATGRTALVVIAALVILCGIFRAGWKGAIAAALIGSVVASLVWTTSPYLRKRVTSLYPETLSFLKHDTVTSAGERIAFWEKSVRFIEAAPLLGNGTGSINGLFAKAAAGQKGALGELSTNPHNQTFAVGIQIGLVGIGLLWLMWIAQFVRFWQPGLLAWIGLVVVAQNIVGSLFNSFIFDFTEGWIYAFGVGVMAGIVRRSSGPPVGEVP